MTDGEAAEIRRLWGRGLCPCCGFPFLEWADVDGVEHKPEAIGEGVMLCGRCMANQHYIEAAETILRALASKP